MSVSFLMAISEQESAPHRRFVFAVSVVCINQVYLQSSLEKIRDLGVTRFHVDLIDDSFNNLGLPPEVVSDLKSEFAVPVDAHLMVQQPERYISTIASRGADLISVHQRSVTPAVINELEEVRGRDIKISIVIEPNEQINLPLVHHLRPDRLTVMAVSPGGAGRTFRPESLAAIRQAAALRSKGCTGHVEVDGAVGPSTVGAMLRHEADHFVLGSTVFPLRGSNENRFAEFQASINKEFS